MKLAPPIDVERAVLPALRDFPRQRRDLAPYGVLWYLLNIPIGRISQTGSEYIGYTGISSAIITIIISLVVTTPIPIWFALVFTSINLFNLVKAPWNCSILWLCFLGFFSPFLLIIPILAKLPIGNWQVEWRQTRQALFWQKNPVYWGSLVLVWLAVLIIRLPVNLLMFA